MSFLRFVLCVFDAAGQTGQAEAMDTDTRTKGLPFLLTLCACRSYVLSCVFDAAGQTGQAEAMDTDQQPKKSAYFEAFN